MFSLMILFIMSDSTYLASVISDCHGWDGAGQLRTRPTWAMFFSSANLLLSQKSPRPVCRAAVTLPYGPPPVIVAEPGLVLLDEPTSGIAQREVEAFAPLLRSLRDDLGCAILIVEHDVPLVMSLSDRVYCLESGRIISEGTPDEVRADPAVIASYLGTEAAAIERSGGGRRTRAGAKRGAR